MLLKTRLSEVNGVFRGFRRWLAVAGLILSAVLMVSAPWRNVPDIAAFSTVFSAEEPSGTSEVFDPFGLLPEDAVQYDEAIFGQMPDMRIMYEGMEILGDVTDLSQLTDDQREALAKLGIQPEALVENRAMLETLLEENRQLEAGREQQRQQFWRWIIAVILLFIALFVLISFWFRRRRRR